MNRPPIPPSLVRLTDRLALFFGCGFFVSYLPAYFVAAIPSKRASLGLQERKWTGAGLLGSLWGAFTYLLLSPRLAGSYVFLILCVLASVVIGGRAEKLLRNHDDPRIVIDEWIGVWIALWGLPPVVTLPFVCGVVLFRFFDVWKGPWGRAAQHLPGGWGVTMDDVLAGLAANLVVRLVFVWLPSVTGSTGFF